MDMEPHAGDATMAASDRPAAATSFPIMAVPTGTNGPADAPVDATWRGKRHRDAPVDAH